MTNWNGSNGLKLTVVKSALRARGIRLTHFDGEYRVTLMSVSAKRAEAVAYYTNDLQDAYETGLFMSSEPKVNEN